MNNGANHGGGPKISCWRIISQGRNIPRRGSISLGRILRGIPYLFPMVFLLLFFFYPIVSVLRTGFMENGDFTSRYITDILGSPHYRHVIGFTIEQAFYSALATLLLGLPAAYLLAKHDFRGKVMVRALITIPFVLPTITVALGFILLFGKYGVVNDVLALFWERKKLLYNLQSIVLAHTFFNFAIVVRLVGASWGSLDPRLEEAAASLGAPPWKRFLHITLPQLLPAIAASFTLAFMYCFMSFTIVLVMGGVELSTVEVEIFTLNNTLVEYELASALAVVQITFTLMFLYVYTCISSRFPDAAYEGDPLTQMKRIGRKDRLKGSPDPKSRKDRLKDSPDPKDRKARNSLLTIRKTAIACYVVLILVIIVGPMVEVVRHSFIVNEGGEDRYSLEAYRMILDPPEDTGGVRPMDAIINSLFFAFMTMVVSIPLGTIIACYLHGKRSGLRNVLGALFMLPLGISAITLALGLLRGYSSGLLVLNGTWYGIVIAHSILAYPFVMRSVSSSLKSFNPHLRDAAMSLGADRVVTFFRVELPLIMPGILVGAIFAFSISMGELGATYMIHKPEYATLPMVIYRYIGSREFGIGSALSVVLMCIVFLSFVVIERTGRGSGSGF